MFYLLGKHLKLKNLSGVNPNTSILDFLRNNNLCGTKEGCGSGDCGACSVVVGELSKNSKLHYKSINSCIALVGSLIGKHLISIENLKDENGNLHIVQQSMIDNHGSQCGFCTPGFVMSIFSMYLNENKTKQISRKKIDDFLGGNLCRCTGYTSIVNSAIQSIEHKSNNDFYIKNKNKIIAILSKIQNDTKLTYENFIYEAPTNLKDFANLVEANKNAIIIAGGSDKVLEITQKFKSFEHIISLQRVEELKQIIKTNKNIEIFAGVSLENAKDILVLNYQDFEQYIHRFAGKQVRNIGTICANIANASPIGDMPPALIALNSTLILQKKEVIREILLEDFFISYKKTELKQGEFIRSVILPKLQNNEDLFLYKISKRFEDDISAISIACKIQKNTKNSIKNIIIAFGGMAEIPKRAKQLEKIFINDISLFNSNQEEFLKLCKKAIINEFTPLSDMRASSKYRIEISVMICLKIALRWYKNENIGVAYVSKSS